MCSIFVTTMDNYQGDLTDILRASGTSSSSSSQPPAPPASQQQHHHHWQQQHHQFSSHHDPMSFSSVLEDTRGGNYFGDPFSTLRDPFLQELDMSTTPTPSSYFNITTTTSGCLEQTPKASASASAATTIIDASVGGNSISNNVFAHKVLEDPHDQMRSSSASSSIRPCKNIFSNMIQISPNAKLPPPYDSSLAPSPRPIKPSAVLSPNITINANNTSKDSHLLDNTGLQISSSRNTTGLKRRKNQAKKVVCIPAPAAANSRQTGEVVPSDLWAWRKYGQKPIKGSPYPRGYYRCSSSKGCSARKQVERSRTDPNMLVITYTSEHNHPWPTQRNALAGSTRSQPSKTNNTSLKNSETSQSQKGTKNPKEENENNNNSDGNNSNSPVVKEEMEDIEKLQIEMDEAEFSDGIGLPYKSSMMESNNQSHEDFFAELGELEADPLNLLFNQGFGGNSTGDDHHHQKESKALDDPFHLFDWTENTINSTNNSFEESNKRRL